ncbi:hypothetical protein KQI48_10250 [Cellulomonas hominis]|uniref:hypothetical protein n=1 Tax=Cellulomonas hominis TaxID=156981 RepID=UPI001C0F6895|nr:hypothetical protein [Cellulomonas hominis]MBU5423044.1 hypothetical protein [Cellulomonas hominis]
MSEARFRMTRVAVDEAADSRSVAELAERLTHDPSARYEGAVPGEVGAVAHGVLTWGGRPGAPREHHAAVTVERLA